MLRKIFFLLLFFISICFSSSADVVHLKNGNKMESIILEDKPDEIIMQLNIGTVVFNHNQIEKVERWSEEENQSLEERWLREREERKKEIEEIKSTRPAKTQITEKTEEIQEKKVKKKKVKYVIEPVVTRPPRRKKISSNYMDYEDLLNKTTLMKLKRNPDQTYYIYLPKKYSPSKEWPLFIGIHGLMADGKQAMDLWKGFADKEGFILVCPNLPDGYPLLRNNADKQMIDIIEEVRKNFRIDKEKVFMTGFSGGAQFLSRFVFKRRNVVRAASIISGRWFDLSIITSSVKTDFLVTVGANDKARISDSRKLAERLKDKKYDVKFKISPGAGHWVCDEAKELTIELFREMKSQKVNHR
ncbi:MAG: dienelactone hydrolase family protein [Candidatus Kappaea frigidicola]|nr:dienelactone hydrolase family protein [Candidatus Kappaea frigidicola]